MIRLWVCLVRREAFVGGESQRCRHGEKCPNQSCVDGIDTGSIPKGARVCRFCNGSGQVSVCGEMELIGGEPIEWCQHGAPKLPGAPWCWYREAWGYEKNGPCEFESNVRVGP